MVVNPDRCPLCAAGLTDAMVDRLGGVVGGEGPVCKVSCAQCGRVWITTAAWERLLDWHDGGPHERRRATDASAVIRDRGRGRAAPIALRHLQRLSGS